MPRKKAAKEVSGKELTSVKADAVKVVQSHVKSAEGKNVQMRQVCAITVDADKMEMDQSATMYAHGADIRMQQSAPFFTACQKATIEASTSAITVAGNSATATNSLLGMVAAREVKVKDSRSIMLLANRVEGNVTTLLNTRAALGFGLVAGGILGLFSLLRRR